NSLIEDQSILNSILNITKKHLKTNLNDVSMVIIELLSKKGLIMNDDIETFIEYLLDNLENVSFLNFSLTILNNYKSKYLLKICKKYLQIIQKECINESFDEMTQRIVKILYFNEFSITELERKVGIAILNLNYNIVYKMENNLEIIIRLLSEIQCDEIIFKYLWEKYFDFINRPSLFESNTMNTINTLKLLTK